MEEKTLYEPIKRLFELKGFAVKGEVKNLDLLAVRDNLMIGVELKTKISLKLIYQAIERTKICEKVYLGIPEEALKTHQKNIRSFYLLIRRLNLGLITVKNDHAKVIIDAKDYDLVKSIVRNKHKKNQTMTEFNLRDNLNVKGGTKGVRMTHYREQVINVRNKLYELGISSPKILKEMTHIEKTYSILQKNYYGWFEKVERGRYKLSDSGIDAIKNESI